MSRKFYLPFLLLIFPFFTFSQSYRAGEITYKWISDYTYEFTLIIYLDSFIPEVIINWGDGTSDLLQISSLTDLPNGIKKHKFVDIHTFALAGTYTISFEACCRPYGIVNIPNSVDVPFFISTTLVISPSLGPNNSPDFFNIPIDSALVGHIFIHNPSAYDSDNDSIVYILDICKGGNGTNIVGYFLPSEVTLDPNTGNFVWDIPLLIGDFNFAIKIKEYRNGILLGCVIRETQVTVLSNSEIIENQSNKGDIIFFPNPLEGNYTLQFISNSNDAIEVNVFNIIGQSVYSENFKAISGINNINIDLTRLSVGMYFLKAKVNDNLYSAKIAKE